MARVGKGFYASSTKTDLRGLIDRGCASQGLCMLERLQVTNVPARNLDKRRLRFLTGVQVPPKLSDKVKTWNVAPQIPSLGILSRLTVRQAVGGLDREVIYSLDSLTAFEESLKSWYFWATHSRLPPMIKAAKTVKRH
jgi:hypothetical protein